MWCAQHPHLLSCISKCCVLYIRAYTDGVKLLGGGGGVLATLPSGGGGGVVLATLPSRVRLVLPSFTVSYDMCDI